jgi:hypothetical protein
MLVTATNMASKGQESGLKVKILPKCVRPHLLRSNAPTSHAAPRSHTAPTVTRSTQSALAVICVRTQVLCGRTHAHVSPSRPQQLFAIERVPCVRPQITGAFERTPVTCQPINRTLGPFVRELNFWACFREQFATIGPALPFSLYLFTLV